MARKTRLTASRRAQLRTALILAGVFTLATVGLVLLTWHATEVRATAEATLSTSTQELDGLTEEVKQAEATSSSLNERIDAIEATLATTEGFLQ